MSLKLKIFLVLFAVLILYGAAGYTIQRVIILPDFLELEKNYLVKDLERSFGAINEEIRALDILCSEWAAWDDTYNYVEKQEEWYRRLHLVRRTYDHLQVDLIYLFDTEGRVVWGNIIDPGSRKFISWPEFSSGIIPTEHPFLNLPAAGEPVGKRKVTGVIMVNGEPMMISARPIIKSSILGPSRGILVMGRFISAPIVARMRSRSVAEMVVLKERRLLSDFQETGLGELKSGEPYAFEDKSDDRIHIMGLYRDIYGGPACIVKTSVKKDISIRGRTDIRYAFYSIFLLAVLVLVVVMALIERVVLSPLGRLTSLVTSIEKAGDYSKRMGTERKDEIGVLARACDRMMSRIETQTGELEILATVDGLTNVANRREFDRYLKTEWKRMLRENKPLSMVLMDVDYFKTFNDIYGHQAGDRCLKRIAEALKKHLKRPGDLAARYGGEEFAVILPDTDLNGALRVAETIRKAILTLGITHSGHVTSDYVTASSGVASLPPSHENNSPELLIQLADSALYLAKERGRNRVCSPGDSV